MISTDDISLAFGMVGTSGRNGADLKLPGMLNAAIKECPVMGGKIKSFDAAADLHHLLHARHLLDLGLRLTKIRIPIFTPDDF
jgi:hypothetical protein